jgi:hypothetical protein
MRTISIFIAWSTLKIAINVIYIIRVRLEDNLFFIKAFVLQVFGKSKLYESAELYGQRRGGQEDVASGHFCDHDQRRNRHSGGTASDRHHADYYQPGHWLMKYPSQESAQHGSDEKAWGVDASRAS